MSMRTVELRMPPLAEVTRHCKDAQQVLTRMWWTLDDARREQDADELVFTESEVRDWIDQLKDAAVALAFASCIEEVAPEP